MEYGLVMVLFLAGIQRISPELFDAAKVDGAGLIGEVRHVTIPGLRYELVVAVVVTLIDSFRNFALIFNLTKGGPGNATVVPVLEVYRRGILHGRVGSASAIGITITVDPRAARPRRAVARQAAQGRRMNRGPERVLVYVVLAIAVAFAVAPIIGILLVALQANASVGGSITSVTDLTLDNLGEAWTVGSFGSSLGSSASSPCRGARHDGAVRARRLRHRARFASATAARCSRCSSSR